MPTFGSGDSGEDFAADAREPRHLAHLEILLCDRLSSRLH